MQRVQRLLKWAQERLKIDVEYAARAGFWVSLAQVLSAGLGLAGAFAFANLLPKETYGNYRYILAVAGSIGALTFTGISTAITQAVARGHEHVLPYAFKVQLRWNFVPVGAAILGGAYYHWSGNPAFALPLWVIGVFSPISSALGSYNAVLLGRKDFKRWAIYAMATSVFQTATMVGAILLSGRLELLAVAYAASQFVPAAFFYKRVVRTLVLKARSVSEERTVLSFGRHVTFSHLFSDLSSHIDKLILFHFVGPAQLASYAVASGIPDRIKGLMKSATLFILPRLSSRSLESIRQVFYTRVVQCITFGALVSLAYALLAPVLFALLFSQYPESVRYSQVLSLSLILVAVGAYMSAVVQSQRLIRTLYVGSGMSNVLRITLFVVMGAKWGIWGIVSGSLLSYAFGLLAVGLLWSREGQKQAKRERVGSGNIDGAEAPP